MKQLFIVLLVAIGFSLNAQSDTAKKEVAVVIGGSFGGGWSTTNATSSHNYLDLLQEEPFYLTYTAYCAVLFKERIGFRLTMGRLGGSNAASTTIDEYGLQKFSDYHYLPEYSELHAGYHYMYFAPQFTYRVGGEPFNATFSLGGGMGSLHTPHGVAIFQKNGSNDFVQLTYHSSNVLNYHAQMNIEFAYMRQLSQHFFANVGLYAEGLSLFSYYEYHVAVDSPSQLYPFWDGGHRSDMLMHINTGIFLNFQWNKRESERAIYE